VKRAVIRLPIEVVDRLDRLAVELRAAHPGELYSRASVMRALISSGLALAEAHRERMLDVARVARDDEAAVASRPKPASARASAPQGRKPRAPRES
jgi:hypothetical protein